jgi:iron(II)-dependent oxidoreductase
MGAQNKDPSKPNYDPEAFEDESPVHEVDLDAYRIARYPVTVGEYQQFLEHGGYAEPKWWKERRRRRPVGSTRGMGRPTGFSEPPRGRCQLV